MRVFAAGLSFLLSGALTACAADYEILRDRAINNGTTRDVVVRIVEPISEDAVKAMAMRIKDSDSRTYPKTSVFFLLPGMEVDAAAWARAVFDPAPTISIIGATVEQQKAMNAAGERPQAGVIGVWFWNLPGGSSHRITLEQRGDKVFMRKVFSDGSSGEYELIALGDHKYFEEDNDFGEWMQINPSGDLELCNPEGKRITITKTTDSPPLTADSMNDEKVAKAFKAAKIAALEQKADKIAEDKKAAGKTRDRDRMKKLIQDEKDAKAELLVARKLTSAEWLDAARRQRPAARFPAR